VTGTKPFKYIQRAVVWCETVCIEKANSPLSSQLKATLAVGVNGFPHRYQRGNISCEMLKADSLLSIGVVPRSLQLRLLLVEDGAFFASIFAIQHKEDFIK